MKIFSNEALKDRVILITGATGGIGSETAKVVADMGAKVVISGRNDQKLAKLKEELLQITSSSNIFSIKVDITSENERLKLVKASMEQFGSVYGLVNAAAIAKRATVDQLTENEITDIMHLNYISTAMLTQLVYNKMINEGKGSIVNVSSLSGLRGTYGFSAYAASKFALIGFTHSLAAEAIRKNIRVNAVCPGMVDTEMGKGVIKSRADYNQISFEEQLEQIKAGIPSGEITTPKEVANTIAYLLTDAAENIIGESVKISGGSVMR